MLRTTAPDADDEEDHMMLVDGDDADGGGDLDVFGRS
jgi:hypothetical protein